MGVSKFFIRITYVCNKSKAIYEKEKDEIEKKKMKDNEPKLSDFLSTDEIQSLILAYNSLQDDG